MRFLVFGVSKFKKFYNIHSRKNLSNNKYDFYESLHSYEFNVNSGKYKKVFFLVDFGDEKNWPYFFRGVKYDEHNFNPVPWLMLARYNSINSADMTSLPWIIVLKLKGFKEHFDDPVEAMKRYIYYMDNSIKCEIYVDFNNISDSNYIFVSDTSIDIAKKKHDSEELYCRKYKIEG